MSSSAPQQIASKKKKKKRNAANSKNTNSLENNTESDVNSNTADAVETVEKTSVSDSSSSVAVVVESAVSAESKLVDVAHEEKNTAENVQQSSAVAATEGTRSVVQAENTFAAVVHSPSTPVQPAAVIEGVRDVAKAESTLASVVHEESKSATPTTGAVEGVQNVAKAESTLASVVHEESKIATPTTAVEGVQNVAKAESTFASIVHEESNAPKVVAASPIAAPVPSAAAGQASFLVSPAGTPTKAKEEAFARPPSPSPIALVPVPDGLHDVPLTPAGKAARSLDRELNEEDVIIPPSKDDEDNAHRVLIPDDATLAAREATKREWLSRGILVGQWEPDDSRVDCNLCGAKFGFFTRRHHCRRCRRLFCGHCSSRTLKLPCFRKAKRVCDMCFGEFKEIMGDQSVQ